MKLSKSQQYVVDKMREGWALYMFYSGNVYLAGNNYEQKDVKKSTFISLRRQQIIEVTKQNHFIMGLIYQLTEKYLNND